MGRAYVGITILVLAASCGLAIGQATAQAPPKATPPLTTNGAAGGRLPDIVGLEPGIPFQEAYSRLKAYNKIAKVGVGRMMDPDFGADTIPYAMVLAEDGATSAELIGADVTLPPGKQLVWRLVRTIRFTAGKEPLITNLLTALREKYGPESYVIQSTTPTPVWYFDEQGKRVTETGGLSFANCAAFGGPQSVNTGVLSGQVLGPQYVLKQPVRRTGTDSDLCRSLVIVRATFQPFAQPGSLELVLASTLTVSIIDYPLELREHDATVEFLTRGAAAQREKELENANQQAKPKL
jgi:hypothetical protein